MNFLDLHIHSCYSDDGEFTPKQLIELCVKEGVRIASISDHNSLKGLEEGQYWAEKKGVTFIPGIELDCIYEKTNLHVLGYWIDPKFQPFIDLEEDLLLQQQATATKRMELVKEIGIIFSSSALLKASKNGVVTGEMIAEYALKIDKDKQSPLLEPYYAGGSRSDNPFVNFYWDFCSQGKPAYMPISFISLEKCISLILDAGGIPILAHPGITIKENLPLLDGVLAQGICGIEVYSSYHSITQTQFYFQQALNKNKVLTCGSDFHGKTKPSIHLGSVSCANKEEQLFSDLKKCHASILERGI